MKKSIFCIAAVTAITIGVGNVWAKDFDQRISLDDKSRINGLGEKTLELLERVPGPGPAVVAKKIAARFANRKSAVSTFGDSKMEVDHNNVKIMGDGWIVKTWGTGSKFMYFNEEYTARRGYKNISLDARFSNETLEKMGRTFIKENLKGLVTLGKGETLVPLKTEFEVEGSIDESEKMAEEKIVSSIVVFGRKIDGINVVGPGSTIAIFFANDGVPFAFDVDWPVYKRAQVKQNTVPVSEIYERLSTYGAMNKGVQKVNLHKFDCGYFDAGERDYDLDSYIQAGCVAQTIGIKNDIEGNEMISPVVNFVPAGVDVVWDDNWLETQLVGLHGDQCMETDLSDCIPDVSQAEQGAMKSKTTDNLSGHVSVTD